MRHVVIDLAGNQRGSFESRRELLDELREAAANDPAALEQFHVLVYDDEGNQVVPARRADEVLAPAIPTGQVFTLLFDFVSHNVRPVRSPESEPWYQEVRARASSPFVGQPS